MQLQIPGLDVRRQSWIGRIALVACLNVSILTACAPQDRRKREERSVAEDASPSSTKTPSPPMLRDADRATEEGHPPDARRSDEDRHVAEARRRMVEVQLEGRDITDERVLAAMRKVPRHRFVPEAMRRLAYADSPLPIGHDQTISQPYIVALMTQLAEPGPQARALDVGTGSGYQAAVLAELVDQVYSIEIVEPLAEEARERLDELGYENFEVRHGDGYEGWPEHAPFDVIIVAAAPKEIPQPLLDQLAPGGRLVIPVGGYLQRLTVVAKNEDGKIEQRRVAPVAFVPMTGEATRRRADEPVRGRVAK